MLVKLVDSELVANNIRTFHFEKPAGFGYIAGQFIQMSLPHDSPDTRGTQRWFTLSSSPTEDHLAITTKFAGDSASSFKKTLFALEPGASVEITEAEGDFTLPDEQDLELVFIAGGIGVTPYRSMTKWLTDQSQKRSITLVYAVQSQDELAFTELFTAYGATVIPSVGQRFTTQSLMATIGEPAGKLIYLAGPEPMVEALTDSLKTAGLPEEQLRSDYFPGYENNYSS